MVERTLHELQVPGLAQELGSEIVAVIMEAEADYPSALAQPTPCDLHAGVGEGMPLALHAAVACALRHIGEDVLGMVTLQRPQNFTDRRRDRCRDELPALAELHNLAHFPLYFRPAQRNAFLESQP